MRDNTLNEVIAHYAGGRGVLLAALKEIQDREGYVPDEAIVPLAKALSVSPGDVHGVISFYRDLRTVPPGHHRILVCRGDSCAAVGVARLAESVEEHLGIPAGATDEDGKFTYEHVFCLGNCALSPSISVDGEVFGRVTPERLAYILEELAGD